MSIHYEKSINDLIRILVEFFLKIADFMAIGILVDKNSGNNVLIIEENIIEKKKRKIDTSEFFRRTLTGLCAPFHIFNYFKQDKNHILHICKKHLH